MFEDEKRTLSLEEGRRLLTGTQLADLGDEDLQCVLESVRTFCEICFDMQMDRQRQSDVHSQDENSREPP